MNRRVYAVVILALWFGIVILIANLVQWLVLGGAS